MTTSTLARPSVSPEKLQKQIIEQTRAREDELINRPQPESLIDMTFSEGVDGWAAFGEALERLAEKCNPIEHLEIAAITARHYSSNLVYDRLETLGGHYAAAALRRCAKTPHEAYPASTAPLHRLRAFLVPPLERETNTAAQFELDLLSMFSPRAHQFVSWVEGDPRTVKLPGEYPGQRLKSLTGWLGKLGATEFSAARENVLKRILALEPKYRILHDQFRGITCEDEWNEADVPNEGRPRWKLPLWDGSSEGQLCEEWCCYSGALMFLNRECGYRLVDLDLKGNS